MHRACKSCGGGPCDVLVSWPMFRVRPHWRCEPCWREWFVMSAFMDRWFGLS